MALRGGTGAYVLVVVGVCVTLSVLCGASPAGQDEVPVRYDGYQLWRVTPQTEVELEVLELLATKHNLSFWLRPSVLGRPVDIMVNPSHATTLTVPFHRSFASFQVLQTDIQRVIDEQFVARSKTVATPGFEYGQYHTLDEIMSWIDDTVTAYGNLASKIEIGRSYEGRPLYVLKISTSSQSSVNVTAAEKPGIFIQGGIHAREWISPATVIYMTNQLLKQYNISGDVTEILNQFDWFILPVGNVDGYEFTWTNDRLWRKTRSHTYIPLCRGVDPNRNWDDHWCESGASRDPCDDRYCGPSPFSEVEVRSISDFIKAGNFVGFIDFHSYSQLWMTPWGWTTELPPDYITQIHQAEEATKAINSVHGTKYKYGTIANIIYESAGSSADWTYDQAGIVYSVGVELQDTGMFGFLLPADQIIPSGEETFEGLKTYALYIINNQ